MQEPIFFRNTPEFNWVKSVIKDQGESICRHYFAKNVISNALSKFDYGFCIIEKARIGKATRRDSDRYQVHSFILFEILDSYKIFIHLICVGEMYKGEGNILLKNVVDFAKEHKIRWIELHSLPEEGLVEWYKSKGFVVKNIIYTGNEIKVFDMIKEV